MRRILYTVISIPNKEEQSRFDRVEKDIFFVFGERPGYYLFSVTQIADRTRTKRGKVKRRIEKWAKRGFVKRHSGGYKN